ncbi:hypothetical protein [Algoriphagus terrigena]|nr:hypothetical protein [Algoriphagus terrigena]
MDKIAADPISNVPACLSLSTGCEEYSHSKHAPNSKNDTGSEV